jgi:hypothetical protein
MKLDDNFLETLRKRTIEILKLMRTEAGEFVEDTRVPPFDPKDSPRINVYTPNQHFTFISNAPPHYETQNTLVVVAYTTNASKEVAEASMELFRKQILSLLHVARFLAQPVKHVTEVLVATDLDGSGRVYSGVVTVSFTVLWEEVFEPWLAPFSGTALPLQTGIPLDEIVITTNDKDGTTLTTLEFNSLSADPVNVPATAHTSETS